MLQEAHEWLIGIIGNEYMEWVNIRSQLSDDRWAWYAAMPETYDSFPEVILHTRALKALKRALKVANRPAIFRKGAKK